jgi:hypothetical protein
VNKRAAMKWIEAMFDESHFAEELDSFVVG